MHVIEHNLLQANTKRDKIPFPFSMYSRIFVRSLPQCELRASLPLRFYVWRNVLFYACKYIHNEKKKRKLSQ